MKRILFLALTLALLIIPAPLRAQNQHNFSRWEPEITAFERSDRTNLQKGAVLFIGSSTIRMWNTLAQDFPQHPVINRGFGGSEIVDSTHFADRIIFPYQPSAIFLRAGGNDLNAGKSPEQVFEDFKQFEATVHAKLPQTDIFYISLSPSLARWGDAAKTKTLNTLVADFIKGKPHLTYIETYSSTFDSSGKLRSELFRSDKLHFNAEGYKILADCVRPYFPK